MDYHVLLSSTATDVLVPVTSLGLMTVLRSLTHEMTTTVTHSPTLSICLVFLAKTLSCTFV